MIMIEPIKNINDLPSVDNLRRKLQAMAMLDAIIMPEWEYRYFSFNNNWDGEGKEMMASMRDGSGNGFFINFTDYGIIGKVYYREISSNLAQDIAAIPSVFSSFLNEPAFNILKTTFFFWRSNTDNDWFVSPSKSYEYPLLGLLAGGAREYKCWAEEYFEISIDTIANEAIFNNLDINPDNMLAINPDVNLEDIKGDISEIL